MACEWILLNTETLEHGATFARLASEQFLKVRGNRHLQVEMKKTKNRDLQMLQPRPHRCGLSEPPTGASGVGPLRAPGECGGDGAGLEEREALGRLGHVIRLRGGGAALPFAVSAVGRPGGPRHRRGGEGRGAFAVQDAPRRRAEVTRLLLGAGLAAPSPGSKPAPLQIQISVMRPRSR